MLPRASLPEEAPAAQVDEQMTEKLHPEIFGEEAHHERTESLGYEHERPQHITTESQKNMTKSNNDLATHLINTAPQAPLQKPTTVNPERLRPDAEREWEEQIMRNMKRMATDEAYRLEIAKKLS